MRTFISLSLAIIAGGAAGFAQLPTPLAFEAASIRISDPAAGRSTISDAPGSLAIRAASLKTCIEWAYDVQSFQVSGPGWLGDARFDISAKAAGPADKPQLRLMLRALLAERFALKAHSETKETAVYFLRAPDGPRFHDSGPKDRSKFLKASGDGPDSFNASKSTGIAGTGIRMADLAGFIAQPLERPVIDKTGLPGRYDFRVDVTSYLTDGAEGHSDEFRAIFTGFQSQLGLKIEPGKDSVEFLIIDSVNRVPTEN